MMKIPIYQVDAFTKSVFSGNPAAVCPMDTWLDDRVLQGIAADNNLSETAFLVPISSGRYHLRWFTPKTEVDLCGHATLASAFVIFAFVDQGLTAVEFETKSGRLSATQSGERLSMDFPARKAERIDPPAILADALGAAPAEVYKSRDLLVVFEEERIIRTMVPDFEKVKEIRDALGIIVTAPGEDCDFVSRFFAPNVGIPEDPVTGSAHCTLIPYWAERLDQTELHALQLSERGGEIFCEHLEERVRISGHAVLYLKGDIYL
jgi:PhzF family phenazine biosynthesis protein